MHVLFTITKSNMTLISPDVHDLKQTLDRSDISDHVFVAVETVERMYTWVVFYKRRYYYTV